MCIKRYSVFALLSAALILQLTIACSSLAQPIQGERWVVFPAEQASEQGLGTGLVQDGHTVEYWTPSEDDVLKLENGLSLYLQQTDSDRFNEQKAPIWERLDEYNRQYIGITLDGKQLIYANYFCDSLDRDWRKDFLFVMDGGDCYFQFKYDTYSMEFFDLLVNGNA